VTSCFKKKLPNRNLIIFYQRNLSLTFLNEATDLQQVLSSQEPETPWHLHSTFMFRSKSWKEEKTKFLIIIQVSLTIRGGYVPGKSSTENTKTAILSYLSYSVICGFQAREYQTLEYTRAACILLLIIFKMTSFRVCSHAINDVNFRAVAS